jgi:hypothetical protein
MSIGLPFVWDQKRMAMVVAPTAERAAARLYVDGETYTLAVPRDRSPETHRQYFGLIRTAWENLPDRLTAEYPSEKALRKRALILTGYYDETRIICASALDARRVVGNMRPTDDFAIVSIAEDVVVVRTAKSQSEEEMDFREFQASKEATLAFVSNLIGVDVTTLQRQAEAA